MNILPELGEIAAAKYGLQMKDPMFRALDKLIQDPKFALIKNVLYDDVADFDKEMQWLFGDETTGETLRDFLDAVGILNGRKGYYSRVENPETEQNICYWINMLIEELANAANGSIFTTLPFVGSGIVNGQRFRAAIYYILDILGAPNAYYAETVSYKTNTRCYFQGKELSSIKVYGNANGVGEQVTPGTGYYYAGFKLYNMKSLSWETDYQLIILPIGSEPLYEGDEVTLNIPDSVYCPFSIYKLELQHFTTDIEPTFKLTRDNIYEATDEDFLYTIDASELSSTSLSYLNTTKKNLLVPDTLGGKPLKTIGNTTFGYSDIKTVIIPEGVETIE